MCAFLGETSSTGINAQLLVQSLDDRKMNIFNKKAVGGSKDFLIFICNCLHVCPVSSLSIGCDDLRLKYQYT